MREQSDRGTAVIAHVLAIGITSLLVMGLLLSAGTLLSDQREATARQEMQTVGNRIAAELTQLDRLSQEGGNVSMFVTHTPQIVGESYSVRVRHGSDCETDRMDPETCLIVSSAGLSVTTYVPIRNESQLAIDPAGSGEFKLSGWTRGQTTSGDGRQSMRTGVGRDFTSTPRVTGAQNQMPVPRFSIDPGAPDSSNDIIFDASQTVDDGRIVNYSWAFGNGDRISSSKPKITYDYDHDPGHYRVWLNVTDNDGVTVDTDQNISVSGLEYNRDLSTGADSDQSSFTMTNNWSSHPVTITSMLIDPPNDIDELDCDGWYCDPTVTVSSDTDSSDKELTDAEAEVENDGTIVRGLDTTVQPGDDVTVTVDDYGRDVGGAEMSFSVRHEVDGQSNVTRFTDVIGSMEIRDFYLEESGTDLYAVVITDQPLGTTRVEWDRYYTYDEGTLHRSDFSQLTGRTDASANRYAYRAHVNDGFGWYYVSLEQVESTGGVTSGETPIYRVEYVSSLYD